MGDHGVFELGVDDPAKSPDLWQGASGSPVFVDGKIQGVIITAPTNFPANRFAAAPMWRLLQDDAFRKAVNDPRQLLVKRDEWFLSSLVKTDFQADQIRQFVHHRAPTADPGKALACVFADFTVECPDTLAYKLLHQLNSASPGQKQVPITVEYKRGMQPEEWLCAVMEETLHAEAPTHGAIRKALQDHFQEPSVFVLDLDEGHLDNRQFVAGLIHAWQGIKLDQPHCLLLLHCKPQPPNLLRRWCLSRWAKRMRECLGGASRHLIRSDTSPAIYPAHGKAWIEEIAKQGFSEPQIDELRFRWNRRFNRNKPLRYETIRLELKADLKAVKV
jgi:hypothetical protein